MELTIMSINIRNLGIDMIRMGKVNEADMLTRVLRFMSE